MIPDPAEKRRKSPEVGVVFQLKIFGKFSDAFSVLSCRLPPYLSDLGSIRAAHNLINNEVIFVHSFLHI